MSNANPMQICIYSRSPACLETYNVFADVIAKNRKQFNKMNIEIEMVRNTADLNDSHFEPVVTVNGHIASEAAVPSHETVFDILTDKPKPLPAAA